jgi:hypothetical protein
MAIANISLSHREKSQNRKFNMDKGIIMIYKGWVMILHTNQRGWVCR